MRWVPHRQGVTEHPVPQKPRCQRCGEVIRTVAHMKDGRIIARCGCGEPPEMNLDTDRNDHAFPIGMNHSPDPDYPEDRKPDGDE